MNKKTWDLYAPIYKRAMEAVEFGKENSRKIVLIPGNMMSWRQFDHPELMAEEIRKFIGGQTDSH